MLSKKVADYQSANLISLTPLLDEDGNIIEPDDISEMSSKTNEFTLSSSSAGFVDTLLGLVFIYSGFLSILTVF